MIYSQGVILIHRLGPVRKRGIARYFFAVKVPLAAALQELFLLENVFHRQLVIHVMFHRILPPITVTMYLLVIGLPGRLPDIVLTGGGGGGGCLDRIETARNDRIGSRIYCTFYYVVQCDSLAAAIYYVLNGIHKSVFPRA